VDQRRPEDEQVAGNYIDLEKIRGVIALHGLDALRFYLLRAAPFGSDLDWTDADVEKSFIELADVVGNCLNRVVKMLHRYRDGVLPACHRTLRESIGSCWIRRPHCRRCWSGRIWI